MPVRSITRITLDGKVHDLAMNELPIALIKECRAQAGHPPMVLARMFGEREGDLDILAAFLWLARRQAGEKVTLAQVEDALGYGSNITIEQVTEGTSDDVPEAQGGI